MPGSATLSGSGELVTNKIRLDPAWDERCQGSSGLISSFGVMEVWQLLQLLAGLTLGGVYARYWHGGSVTVSWKVVALEGDQGGGRGGGKTGASTGAFVAVIHCDSSAWHVRTAGQAGKAAPFDLYLLHRLFCISEPC